MKYLILECPKCKRTQRIELGAFNRFLQFGGHKYTCGNCYWEEGETPILHDNHVNMEIKGFSAGDQEYSIEIL